MLKFEFVQYPSIWSEEHFLGNCFSDSAFSLSGSVLVPERKSSLSKRWGLYFLVLQKETFTATRNTVPEIIWALEISLVNVIMSITFHMHPRLTNITLNCRVFIIDVNMAIFAGVNYIINICKNAY